MKIEIEIPNSLLQIGKLLREQDNRATAEPMFIVNGDEVVAAPLNNCDHRIWFNLETGEEASEDDCVELERIGNTLLSKATKEDLDFFDKHEERGAVTLNRFCTASFTENGCKDYIKANGHNITNPTIYAESFYRNREMITIRKFLMSLPEPEQ